MTTAPITRAAGRFVAQTRFDDLPPEAAEVARLGFADTFAVMLAGRNEPVTRVVSAYARAGLAPGDAPWLFGQGHAAPEASALIDATAAHALDFDDYAFSNHVSAVLVPVVLACAPLSPDPSGRRMVTAYAVAYEVWADLMGREPDHLHSKGWHPTAVFGPVAAAAAAAHMLGLDAADATNALALAASHAGGLMANFGSMTKPYHAGLAAEMGVRAVRLTQAGMTAQPIALESPVGLLAALSPDRAVDLTRETTFGARWKIAEARINIKKYPTVGASQRIIDALVALHAEGRMPDPAQIAKLIPRVSVKHAAVMPFADPRDAAEAKFSLSFVTAAAVLWGRVGFAEMTPARLADPVLRALITQVQVDAHEDYDPEYPVAAVWDMVTLVLKDGTTMESPKIRHFTGHAKAPLTTRQHWDKFADCAAYGGVDPAIARALFDLAATIDTNDRPAEALARLALHPA
ncbi:MAG: MmgE/PrpD family protein [Pararhodobacter sp.]